MTHADGFRQPAGETEFLVPSRKSSPTGMRLQSLLCNFLSLSLFVWNFLALTSSMNLLIACVRGVCFRNIFSSSR
jgi:hypothetical protein